MLLSICIPTHHGRGWCLKPAIEAMLSQIERDGLQDQVEICVSDNASEDETASFMAQLIQRAPNNVTYARMPFNCGIYNFFNAVRISKGKYCWLFGSDDMPADDMLSSGLDLLKRFPDCSGFSCLYEIYDNLMLKIEPGRPNEIFPIDLDCERQFDSFSEALTELGPSQTFMSVQCFRRDLWDAARQQGSPGYIYIAPNHIHSHVISRILKLDPHWVWSPRKVVRMRNDNTAAYTAQEGPSYNHTVMVMRELTGMWSEVAGSERQTFRHVLNKIYRVDWDPSVVRHHKMLAGHGNQEDFQMLILFTRYLAALPQFWYGSFLALLIPHWFWKFTNSSGFLPFVKRTFQRR